MFEASASHTLQESVSIDDLKKIHLSLSITSYVMEYIQYILLLFVNCVLHIICVICIDMH